MPLHIMEIHVKLHDFRRINHKRISRVLASDLIPLEK